MNFLNCSLQITTLTHDQHVPLAFWLPFASLQIFQQNASYVLIVILPTWKLQKLKRYMAKITRTQKLGVPQWHATSCVTICPESYTIPCPLVASLGCATRTLGFLHLCYIQHIWFDKKKQVMACITVLPLQWNSTLNYIKSLLTLSLKLISPVFLKSISNLVFKRLMQVLKRFRYQN